jgi:hypothetical protein
MSITMYLPHFKRQSKILLEEITPWSLVFLEKPPVAQLLKKLPTFMEPEDSLQCSQEPSTSPYAEPDKSRPYYPIRFL